MRIVLLVVIFHFTRGICLGQDWTSWNNKIDSLQKQLESSSSDSLRAPVLIELGNALISKAWSATNLGEFALAYETYGIAFDLFENPETELFFEKLGQVQSYQKTYWGVVSNLNFNYGHLMGATENREGRLHYYRKAYQIANTWNDILNIVYANIGIAQIYLEENNLDSAQLSAEKAMAYSPDLYDYDEYSTVLYINGDVKLNAAQYQAAKNSFLEGAEYALKQQSKLSMAINYLGLSRTYSKLHLRDSGYFYGIQSLNLLREIKDARVLGIDLASGYENLYQHFQQFEQRDSAFKYLHLASIERSALSEKKIANLAAFQQVLLKKQLLMKDIEKEQAEMQGRNRMYLLVSALIVFLILASILYFSYRQKKKANIVLSAQKEEIQSALMRLKSTQAQLIQSEKMASLGELTAGIAHEIQNPLNFVNNFSEVNTELLQELEEEVNHGNMDEVRAIAKDIRENEQKINHHGKRADAIVKGMLQHSRSSSGQKEPTGINALADEYLRLAYHGLRAKDKSFNATLKTDFDQSIGNINIIPQDIGRVILNLITNAFYEVDEKKKSVIENYEPTVTVSTKKINGKVEISVADNGNGIPQKVLDKIFQPFFTTKPAGQGTGLGLSLTYDIVKAHGGELAVETREGEGAQFIIQLPINS